MTQLDKLTSFQKEMLLEAQRKITIEVVNDLDYGEEVVLNDLYTLYKYSVEDIITVNLTNTWDEILQVMWNDNEITFESL